MYASVCVCVGAGGEGSSVQLISTTASDLPSTPPASRQGVGVYEEINVLDTKGHRR